MTFTLNGTIIKADTVDTFGESSVAGRQVVVEGLVDDKLFEVTLRVQRDTSPQFDPLGSAGLGDPVTLEVTL